MQWVIIWNNTKTAIKGTAILHCHWRYIIVGHFSIRRSFRCAGKTNNSLMDAGAGRPLSTPEWTTAREWTDVACYITEAFSGVGPDSTAGRPVRRLMKIHLLKETRRIHCVSISEVRCTTGDKVAEPTSSLDGRSRTSSVLFSCSTCWRCDIRLIESVNKTV